MASNDKAIVERSFSRGGMPLDPDVQELLSDVVARAKALRESVRKYGQTDGTFQEPGEALKIALISLPVSIKGRDGKEYPRVRSGGPDAKNSYWLREMEFDHFTMCVRDVEDDGLHSLTAWCDQIKADCARAIDAGARIVVLNELAYPNFWSGRSRSVRDESIDTRRTLTARAADLDQELQRLATKGRAIIIAGTSHDGNSFHNCGPIFFPQERFTRDHRKMTTAYRTGEYIKPEIDRYYPVYNLGAFTFSVFVCSDAFDLNIFFQQIAVRGTGDSRLKPKIIFIPSWHDHDPAEVDRAGKPKPHRMVEAARQLSRATDAAVIFVNHAFCQDRHRVFASGFEGVLEPDGNISYYDFNEAVLAAFTSQHAAFREQFEALVNRRKILK